MLRERSSNIASFFEHPAYSIFKMYNILILVFLFWFTTIHPKCFCKIHLFLKFWVFHERSSDIFTHFENLKCPDSSFLYFDWSLFTQSACVKATFVEILGLQEGSIDIASFVEHLVHSISKMCSALIFVFNYFDLSLFTKSICVNVTF